MGNFAPLKFSPVGACDAGGFPRGTSTSIAVDELLKLSSDLFPELATERGDFGDSDNIIGAKEGWNLELDGELLVSKLNLLF